MSWLHSVLARPLYVPYWTTDVALTGLSQSSTASSNIVGCSSCGRCPALSSTFSRAEGSRSSSLRPTDNGRYGSASVQTISTGLVSSASRGRSAARSVS